MSLCLIGNCFQQDKRFAILSVCIGLSFDENACLDATYPCDGCKSDNTTFIHLTGQQAEILQHKR
jgi:hypothetical protein